MALKGKNVLVKIPGSGVSMVGEATTGTGDTVYQVTDTSKQVLSPNASISVHKFDSNDTAEAGTTTTNIEMTAHGLVTGDLIINTTQGNAKRIVTKVDDDNVTVDSVSGQTSGDNIEKCPTEASSAYSLNRLTGKVTYSTAVSRTIYVSGSYLPLTAVAESNEFNLSIEANNEDTTVFVSGGANYVKRTQALKDVTGSLSGFYFDTTYIDYITNDTTIVIEIMLNGTDVDFRIWAKLSNIDESGAVDGVIEESIDYEGVNDSDNNAIAVI